MLVYMLVVCGPVAVMLALDYYSPQTLIRAGVKIGDPRGCERPVTGIPGGFCGMPISARIELRNGSHYQHLHWLCHEHALDAERRATDRLFKITWLG